MNSGFLLIDKPEGVSSFAALHQLKRELGTKKLGHTGTLDPFATGLLVVGVGEALKFFQFLNEEPKVYQTTIKLGIETDTLDHTGKIINESPVPSFTRENILEILQKFIGEQDQIPPMFSAKKIDGQRLYDLAREGEVVERKPCKIRIDSIDLIDCNGDTITVKISCSKGTYIRVLGSDIAKALGTVGHLSILRRLRAGCFDIEQKSDLKILPIEFGLTHLPQLEISDDDKKKLFFGQKFSSNILNQELIVLKNNNQFLGIGSSDHLGVISSKRLMNTGHN